MQLCNLGKRKVRNIKNTDGKNSFHIAAHCHILSSNICEMTPACDEDIVMWHVHQRLLGKKRKTI